ncbi:MAG: hypothetical protein J2P37_21930, partial [Ktedonobacteraceae bacterium]|nr:hypothetical protein [Ktedonobacteraceae bacterium]
MVGGMLMNKKDKSRKRWFVLMLTFLLVVGANVLTFAFPGSVQAAPVYTAVNSVPQEPPTICPPGETPETYYKCFMPGSTTCIDGECFKCDITSCMSAPPPPGMPTDKDSHVANNVPLPASNNNTLFYFTRLDLTVQHPIVQTMWWWVLGAVDALMVFTIMLHGIRIMIAGSVFRYADAAQALPNILLALVAAQFSILIITAFLNLNNAMSLDTYNWANSDNTFKATAWGKVTSCQDSVIKKGDKVDGTDQITWLKPKDDKYLSNIGNVMDGKDDDKTLDDPNVYKHPETYHHMVLDPQYYKWVYEWVDPNHPNKPKMPSDPNHPTDAKKNPEFDESQYTEYAVRSLPAAVRAKPDPTFDKYYLVFAIKTTCKSWQNEIDEVFTQFPEIDTGGFWSNLLHSFGLMFESLTDFLKLVAGLSMLAVIGQMLIRFLLLNLYIVISPMGLASWALPGSV